MKTNILLTTCFLLLLLSACWMPPYNETFTLHSPDMSLFSSELVMQNIREINTDIDNTELRYIPMRNKSEYDEGFIIFKDELFYKNSDNHTYHLNNFDNVYLYPGRAACQNAGIVYFLRDSSQSVEGWALAPFPSNYDMENFGFQLDKWWDEANPERFLDIKGIDLKSLNFDIDFLPPPEATATSYSDSLDILIKDTEAGNDIFYIYKTSFHSNYSTEDWGTNYAGWHWSKCVDFKSGPYVMSELSDSKGGAFFTDTTSEICYYSDQKRTFLWPRVQEGNYYEIENLPSFDFMLSDGRLVKQKTSWIELYKLDLDNNRIKISSIDTGTMRFATESEEGLLFSRTQIQHDNYDSSLNLEVFLLSSANIAKAETFKGYLNIKSFKMGNLAPSPSPSPSPTAAAPQYWNLLQDQNFPQYPDVNFVDYYMQASVNSSLTETPPGIPFNYPYFLYAPYMIYNAADANIIYFDNGQLDNRYGYYKDEPTEAAEGNQYLRFLGGAANQSGHSIYFSCSDFSADYPYLQLGNLVNSQLSMQLRLAKIPEDDFSQFTFLNDDSDTYIIDENITTAKIKLSSCEVYTTQGNSEAGFDPVYPNRESVINGSFQHFQFDFPEGTLLPEDYQIDNIRINLEGFEQKALFYFDIDDVYIRKNENY